MKSVLVLSLFGVLLNASSILARGSSNSKNRILVWICLEFCDETQQQINSELLEIEAHKDIISAVSFEKYTLGPNSTLVDNHLTEVADKIVSMQVEAWPLLSSFPHPPEFIDWMRTVFANPQPFIDSCVSVAKAGKFTGFNLDWEPTDAVTSEDGTNYANFIGTFADALHKEGLLLSVDVATWSPIWNYTAIAATSADYVISMGTYTATDTSFSSQLDKIMVFGPRAGSFSYMFELWIKI